MQLSNKVETLLQRKYLERDENNEVVETPEELFTRVATNIASVEPNKEAREKWKNIFYEVMTNFDFLPNSPTLMNAGAHLQQLAACFVLPVEDHMEGIFNSVRDMALIQKSGGGTGFSFSNLRPKNDVVLGTGGISSGPISFIEVFNSATNTIKQGGKRRGANMGVMRVDHPDILEFISYKDKEGRLSNFNLSVAITDEFMKAVKTNSDYKLINPRNGEIWDIIDANKVWNKIISQAHKNGEPGVIFIDKINKDHPLPEKIESTNPCGEQPLLPYEACNLGSINLSNMISDGEVDWEKLENTIQVAVRFLDNVISVNKYPIPQIAEKTKKYRKIGLGVMGWAEMLIRLNIRYGTSESLELAEEISEFIKITSHTTSELLADIKGLYPGYKEGLPKRRNVTTTTIAPTGSIGILADTTGGIEPLFSREYTHTDADGNITHYKPKYIQENSDAVVTASEIDAQNHVNMQAAWQKYVDNAVSKTINMPNDATKKDVENAYKKAYQLGCKGLTVYRDGSRETQVLKSDANENDKIKPDQRPVAAAGITTKYKTGCGKLYLTTNVDNEGNPIETFIQVGSGGGCASNTEAVSRLISLCLRSNIDTNEIADQLKSVHKCGSCLYRLGKDENIDGVSCPSIVGEALLNNGTNKNKPTPELNECPECGAPTKDGSIVGNCFVCNNCGYSKCG